MSTLICYDGSTSAREAIAVAGEALSGPTTLLHVWSPPDAVITDAFGVRERVSGPPVAQEEASDLIVIGTRGCTAVQSALLGSVSNAVIHHSHRPVLVVPVRTDESSDKIDDRESTFHATSSESSR
jgi:hypothetical protein